MIANYHTHTRWCGHGTGDIEDYVREGIAQGLQELAITEHAPLPGDIDDRRMPYSDFAAFNRQLDAAVQKYAGQIVLRKGLECEYYPKYLDVYRRYRDEHGYTVFALGHHTSIDGTLDNFYLTRPEHLARYADEVCEGLQTGLFSFVAHPDVVVFGYGKVDKAMEKAMGQIFATCCQLDIPVELNASGHLTGRGYPCPEIWQGVATRYPGLRCLVNSDAHQPHHLADEHVAWCECLVQKAGLHWQQKL